MAELTTIVPSGKGEEAYGQIVPLEGDSLLLPNAAVIEVRSLEGLRVRSGPPAWLLGQVSWREHELSVVSIESLLGRAMPARSRRTRLLVINSTGSHLDTGLFAIVCQGYPHLAALNRVAIQSVPLEERDPDALVLSRVKVANTLAIIPDLDAIESRLVEVPDETAAASTDWEPAQTN